MSNINGRYQKAKQWCNRTYDTGILKYEKEKYYKNRYIERESNVKSDTHLSLEYKKSNISNNIKLNDEKSIGCIKQLENMSSSFY